MGSFERWLDLREEVVLYHKGAEAGSKCRPGGSLFGGSVRTLKNKLKSTCMLSLLMCRNYDEYNWLLLKSTRR
jgi:hypothetical protein